MKMTAAALAATLTVAGLVLAACGSAHSAATTTPASVPASGAPAAGGQGAGGQGAGGQGAGGTPTCALAPAALVTSALGEQVSDPAETDNGPVVGCTYHGSHTVLIRFETGMDASAFAQGKAGFAAHGEPTKDLAGIGDEAYTSVLSGAGISSDTLVVRQGPVEILITSPASVASEEALARKLLAAL